MSQTRTETITIETDQRDNKDKNTLKLKLAGLFHHKTSPGEPWPNPPDGSSTIFKSKKPQKDDNGGGCCCFPFRRK